MKNTFFNRLGLLIFAAALSVPVTAGASNLDDIDKQIASYRQMAKNSIKPTSCANHLPASLTAGATCYTAQGYVGVKRGSFVQVYEPKSQKVVYSLSLNKKINWQGRSIDPKSFMP